MNLKRRESDYKGDLVTQTPVGLMFSSLADLERQKKLSDVQPQPENKEQDYVSLEDRKKRHRDRKVWHWN